MSKKYITDDLVASGEISAATIVKTGGTASQFLKADGSVDNNIYLTTQTDSQTLSWNGSTGEISISGGNTIDIDGRFQSSGTYNTIIGTDTDISYSGATVVSTINMNDGVITSHTSRSLTTGDIGAMKIYNATAGSGSFNDLDNGVTRATSATDGPGGHQTVFTATQANDSRYGWQLANTGGGSDIYFRGVGATDTWNSWLRIYNDGYHPNADVWTSSRNFTIGSSTKAVNGSTNMSWSLTEIGAQPAGNYLLDTTDTLTGTLTVTDDINVGTYSDTNTGKLYLNAYVANKRSTIHSTDGNLHLDADSTHGTYLNYYTGTGGVKFGNGAGGYNAQVTGSGNYYGVSFIRNGGLNTQFLKADGSIDTTTYLTTESDTLSTVTSRGASTSNSITLSGGLNIDTNTNTNNLVISRFGYAAEEVSIGVDDTYAHFNLTQDESNSGFKFNITNTDTESGGGASANSGYIDFINNASGTFIKINGISSSTNWDTAYGWGNHVDSNYATQTYVGTKISELVDSSPSALDTLNELAAALGDDPNFATTVTTSIGEKLPLAAGVGSPLTGDLYGVGATFTGTVSGSNLTGTNTGDQDLSGYLTTTGKAADSNKLDNLDSSQFLRSDVNDIFTGALTIDGYIRGNGQQLVLNAGESYNYPTGQTNELVYINSESGLEINSSPNNWTTGWAGRNTTTINDVNGDSDFSRNITVNGSSTLKNIVVDTDKIYSSGDELILMAGGANGTGMSLTDTDNMATFTNLDIDVVGGSITTDSTITATGLATASGFKVPSGTSSQFLKADGSSDSNNYEVVGEFDYSEDTATAYTLSSSDKGQVLGLTSSSAITLTINSGSLASIGDIAYVDQMGSGTITFSEGTGTLLYNNAVNNTTAGQYSRVAIHKVSSTEYRIFGELQLL